MTNRYLFSFFISLVFVVGCSPNEKVEPYTDSSESSIHSNYIGADRCKECHENEFLEWQESDHYFAMQLATDEFVRGNFDTTFTADRISYIFSNSQGEYFVEVEEVGVPNHKFKIEYTFGWHPLQQYLVSTERGKFQTLRASWDTEKRLWFHQYSGDYIEPHDWLSWSKGGQNWNTMCSSCHSTHVKKNYNSLSDSFSTTFEDITVSCEACHGPGLMHQNFHHKKTDKDPYRNTDLKNAKTQVNSCGGCHSRRTAMTDISDPSPKMLDQYIVQKLVDNFYEPDGQIREEDYVFGSFLSSKMYRHKVKCSDCHNSHTGKLKRSGNDLCVQCHAPNKYDTESHTHHPMQSAGSLCVNCHMDGRTYMGNDYRRDHSFRIPRPDQSLVYGTTNACNSCHESNNALWASNHVNSWIGKQRTYHFSDDLLPGSLGNNASFPHLANIIANDSVNDIIRATAVLYLERIHLPEASQLIISSLSDRNEMVRQSAYSLLIHFPDQIKIPNALNGLHDEFKGVRIMAFKSVVEINPMELEPRIAQKWKTVLGEYETYLKSNADFPNGQILLGEYYHQKGENLKAEAAYHKALKMDSLLYTAYSNLAIVNSTKGDYLATKKILLLGLRHFPNQAEFHYYMGLNESQLGNTSNQLLYLKNAHELAPENPNYAYNYILSEYNLGKTSTAKAELQKAMKTMPENSKLISLQKFFEMESSTNSKN